MVALVGKVVLCLAIGFLMYMAAERADAPILCVAILAYLVFMVILWKRFGEFLERSFKVALTISILGLLCIPFALFMRPSVLFTFSERLAMMANGLGYLFVDPITGVAMENAQPTRCRSVLQHKSYSQRLHSCGSRIRSYRHDLAHRYCCSSIHKTLS